MLQSLQSFYPHNLGFKPWSIFLPILNLYPWITLLHLSLVDAHLQPASHDWRPASNPTCQKGLHFSLPWLGMSFCSQHLPRSTTSAPACLVFCLPLDTLLVFTCQSMGGGVTGTFSFELTWTDSNTDEHSSERKSNQLRDSGNRGSVLVVSFLEWPEVNTWPLPQFSIDGKLTLTVKAIKPVWNLKGSLCTWFWSQFNRGSVANRELQCWLY